jgi:type II secretory pathway component PulK
VKPASQVRKRAQHGATLVVGMILLALVSMLALAGAGAAHIELRVAQNERFRENAALAASAGIEYAIGRIVTTPDPATVTTTFAGVMPASSDRYSVVTRLAGFELALPQEEGSRAAGAHFEILSTGHSGRSVDRQRATVMLVVDSAEATPQPCLAETARCLQAGDLVRTSWQRVPAP